MSDSNEPAQGGNLPSVPLQPVVRFVRCEICGTTIHSDETNTVDVEEHDGSHFTIEVCDKCDADTRNVRIVAPFGTLSFNKPNPAVRDGAPCATSPARACSAQNSENQNEWK